MQEHMTGGRIVPPAAPRLASECRNDLATKVRERRHGGYPQPPLARVSAGAKSAQIRVTNYPWQTAGRAAPTGLMM